MERITVLELVGSIITEDRKIDQKITSRTWKATRIYYSINRKILGKREIELTKNRVYILIVVPSIIYAWESWAIQGKHEMKLNIVEMKYLTRSWKYDMG